MSIPDNFKQDISSKEISIRTRVIIKSLDKDIYISSHKLNFEGNYYEPILLSSPFIKESVDYESRNFKISNVSLSLSNYKINEKRFSDDLNNNPLINREVLIYNDSQSSSSTNESFLLFKGYVRRISHTDSTVNIELEDLTELKFNKNIPSQKTTDSKALGSKYRNVPIPIAFGYLKNAPAVLDSGKVLKADSDDSIELIGPNSDSFEPHPVWDEFNIYGYGWTVADNDETTDNYKNASPVRIAFDGEFSYLPERVIREVENSSTFEVSDESRLQFSYNEETDQQGTVRLNPFPSIGTGQVLQVISAYKPTEITCHYRSSASNANCDGLVRNGAFNEIHNGFETPNRFKASVSEHMASPTENGEINYKDLNALNGYEPYLVWSQTDGGQPAFNFDIDHLGYDYLAANYLEQSSQGLIRVKIDSTPPHDYLGLHTRAFFAINGQIIIPGHDEDLDGVSYYSRTLTYPLLVDESYFIEQSSSPNTRDLYLDGTPIATSTAGNDVRNIIQFANDGEIDSHPSYTGNSNLVNTAITIKDVSSSQGFLSPFVRFTDDTKDLGAINMDIGAYAQSGFDLMGYTAGIAGNWGTVDILALADVEFTYDLDFYLYVNGRKDGDNLIRNPIEIMKNIAITELGISEEQIDEDSYESAKLIHDNYKFDFSVNKEIKGKKLLEDIAKSTLCYPYFSNQGKLKFPCFKRRYLYEEDYNNETTGAKLIESFDVISYSFNKTKQENVYTKINFFYNYNYINEKYQSEAQEIVSNDATLLYNGYIDEDGNPDPDNNILKFESPYIRDLNTAILTSNNIFYFYKNQHLTFKLKLPLKYIHIEVGDMIKFDNLLGGIEAYGIDYTTVKLLGNNYSAGNVAYPLFFVTSVHKNLDSISIEAFQAHSLEENGAAGWQGFIEEQAEEEEEEFGQLIIPPDDNISYPTEDEATTTIDLNRSYLGKVRRFEIDSNSSMYYDDIAHFFQPQTYGLNSFDELAPANDWSDFSGYEIRDYVALIIDIKFKAFVGDMSFIHRFTLKNQSNSQSPDNFDLQWENIVLLSTFQTSPFGFSEQGISGPDNYPINTSFELSFEPSNITNFDRFHVIRLGDGLLKAAANNTLNFSIDNQDINNENADNLTFNVGFNVFPTDDLDYALGDVNRDLSVSVGDIIQIVNHMLAGYHFDDDQKQLADVNQNGNISILDVMAIVNEYILGGE
jgi:hypothetical protein